MMFLRIIKRTSPMQPGDVCRGKVAYLTGKAANKAARRSGKPMRHYYCDVCGLVHLATIKSPPP
jgi:hypothetical protein